MNGIIFGVISSILFSILFVLLKKSYEHFSPEVTYFFYTICGIVVWIPFSLWYGVSFTSFLHVLPYALISALLSEALSFYVLSKGEISITGTLLASYPVYTVLLSRLFLGEEVKPVVMGFVLITILGTMLTSLPEKFDIHELQKREYVFWAVIGAIAVGISDTTSKSIIDTTSAGDFLFSLALAQIPVSFGYLAIKRIRPPSFATMKSRKSIYLHLLGTVTLNALAIIFMWLSFEHTLATIASPLSASFPALMVVLAVLFLKEKPRTIDFIGLSLVFLGVLGISFYAS